MYQKNVAKIVFKNKKNALFLFFFNKIIHLQNLFIILQTNFNTEKNKKKSKRKWL